MGDDAIGERTSGGCCRFSRLDGSTDTKELAHMCMCVGKELGAVAVGLEWTVVIDAPCKR